MCCVRNSDTRYVGLERKHALWLLGRGQESGSHPHLPLECHQDDLGAAPALDICLSPCQSGSGRLYPLPAPPSTSPTVVRFATRLNHRFSKFRELNHQRNTPASCSRRRGVGSRLSNSLTCPCFRPAQHMPCIVLFTNTQTLPAVLRAALLLNAVPWMYSRDSLRILHIGTNMVKMAQSMAHLSTVVCVVCAPTAAQTSRRFRLDYPPDETRDTMSSHPFL